MPATNESLSDDPVPETKRLNIQVPGVLRTIGDVTTNELLAPIKIRIEFAGL